MDQPKLACLSIRLSGSRFHLSFRASSRPLATILMALGSSIQTTFLAVWSLTASHRHVALPNELNRQINAIQVVSVATAAISFGIAVLTKLGRVHHALSYVRQDSGTQAVTLVKMKVRQHLPHALTHNYV